jgi:very-short-patch-repair endonuclease
VVKLVKIQHIKKAWNKGLTAQTDQRVANYVLHGSGNQKGNKAWNKGLTKETDQRVAKNAIGVSIGNKGKKAWNKNSHITNSGSFKVGTTLEQRFGEEKAKELREEFRKKGRDRFSDPKERQRMREKRMNQRFNTKTTKPERKLEEYLKENKIIYKTQEPIENMTISDFYIPPNTVMFADGDYWHSIPKVRERDEHINKKLRGMGYHVIRLTESEIKQGIRPTIFKNHNLAIA